MADDRDGAGDSGSPDVRAGRDAVVAGRDATYVGRDYVTYVLRPDQPAVAGPAPSGTLRSYLEALAESYRWLELRGIPEAETLRIELEKVYIALRTEPETGYDLHHLANLHALEVQEAAGGVPLDRIDPRRLAELDAENIRRTYRPRREEAQAAAVADVTDVAAAIRLHRRMVILGGPGSGKTTLGRWLALQFARQLLRQAPQEVVPAAVPADLPVTARLHVTPGATLSFTAAHFVPPEQAATTTAIGIVGLPERGTLTLRGAPVPVGKAIGVGEIGLLGYAPTGNECGSRYACIRFTAGGRTPSRTAGVVVLDVGTHVAVPASQVDPDSADGPDGPGAAGPRELADLGPARVPVFLRLAHFADELAGLERTGELAERRRRGEPPYSLAEYLGRDPDSARRPDGHTADSRNALLRAVIGDGQAVVILDGLDELPEASRRTVSLAIERFIEAATRPDAADAAQAPARTGGNQVIVTSRYVGYKLMPIESGCAHFGIQPMRRPAVEHFVRSWSAAVNAKLAPAAQGPLSAGELITEIYDTSRPAISELATNPLLITILAIVYRADGALPDQRAGIYDRVVENLLLIWLDRPECQDQLLLSEEVLAALQPLAAEMQGDSSSLIGLGRIEQLMEGPLAVARGTVPDDPEFRTVLDTLLTVVRKHVGLLAEQSAGNYAFFHRTIQEFLAARHLLAAPAAAPGSAPRPHASPERAAARIVERLDDPQWREPLLLALGLAMIEWDEPQARAGLLAGVLAADGPDTPLPQGALLVMSALPDLADVPPGVLTRLIGQLLRSYAASQDQPRAEGLRETIRGAFKRLLQGPQAGAAAQVIAAAISQDAPGQEYADQDYAGAAAEILTHVGWFTTEIVDGLLRVAHRDQSRLGWPVRWALVDALGRPANDPSSPGAQLDTARLIGAHLPMRQLLQDRPDLTAAVRDDSGWLWLLVALYGGLGHGGYLEQLRSYQHARLQDVRGIADGPPGPPPPLSLAEFSPGEIVFDLADQELSATIALRLRAGDPASALTSTFRRTWERPADPQSGAEALIGLAALGEDVIPLLHAALADPGRQAAAQAALARLRWLGASLREPVARAAEAAARTIPADAPPEHQGDLLRVVIRALAASGAGPLMVSDTIPAYRYVAATMPGLRASLDAEYWAYAFSGLAAEAGTVDAALQPATTADPHRLIRSWSRLPRAGNFSTGPRLPWPQAILAPRCDTPVEQYLAMLDQAAASPPELGYHAGLLLGTCRPLLDDQPALIWETLALCCSRGGDFLRGYLVGATGDRALRSGCATLAAGLAAAWERDHRGHTGSEGLRDTLAAILDWRCTDGYPVKDGVLGSVAILVAQASAIGDPFLRFRALCRAIEYTRLVPQGLDINTVVAEIADAHDQARAIEWLLLAVPGQQVSLRASEDFLDDLAALFAAVADPENRALAQGRLALIAPGLVDDLLGDALDAVRQIADPRRRADVISEIRAALGTLPGVAQGLDSAAGALPEPWLRDRARGRDSRLVAAYRDQYRIGPLAWRVPPDAGALGAGSYRLASPAGHLAWGTLYLAAVAAEAEPLAASPTGGGEAGWELLLGSEPRAGVDALLESLPDGGLRLPVVAASAVNRVIQSGQAAALRPLWPYLDSPDAGAMAVIARWPADDPDVRRWKALVQMEAGYLTPDIAAPVVELLTSPADRLRLRAALALHGPRPYSNNRNRRWAVSRVGAAAVEGLAAHAIRADHPPAVQSTFLWVQSDIHHDDGAALDQWLAAAATDASTPAGWLLRSMESLDEPLFARLLARLPAAPPGLQRALLQGLARLANAFRIPYEAQGELQVPIAEVPAPVRRELRVLPQGPAAILAAVAMAAAEPAGPSGIALARSIVENSMIWLDDECLADGSACLNRLKAIGGEYYIRLDHVGYSVAAEEAAVPLTENEDALRLLLAWAQSPGPAEDAGFRADLLIALEAVARISPVAFTALAAPDTWEPILIEWVATSDYWTGRLAAIRLLSLLRRVTDRVADALRVAMQDNIYVQRAAYAAVAEFRTMKGDVLPALLALLANPSAGVAASTARLLASLARGEGAADRRRILGSLRDAVASAPRGARVYLMQKEGDGGTEIIEFVDRLDRVLYQAIFEVSGS
ncbi:MAG TPA: hypothetical protein VH478_01215 [Trebonia sp.]|nr:hypothetical protein [Trebonia sp.]